MAGVFIDIPGVGNIEANNAASEATLREILAAISSAANAGGGAGGGAGAGAGGGAGGGGRGAGAGGLMMTVASKLVSTSFKTLGFAAGAVTGAIQGLASTAIKAAGAYKEFSDQTVAAVTSLSRLDGSVRDAANIFSKVPIFGGLFSAVAAATDDVIKSFNAVSQTGATFGGSLNNFAAAASQAGMNLQEFGSMIAKNGNAMTAFGTTTEGGAANFARVSKQLRSTSSDLYAMGFSTQDINQGLASYGALMKSQGLQGKKSNAELAQGAKSYLKEMDLLAKVTGQSRSDIEASRAAMAKDAQFQASMAGLGEGVRNSFMSVTDGLQDTGLKNFAKDIMATGTATTEENQKLMAMMPQSAAMLQRMNQKMQRGEAVTLEERNSLNNLMKQEGAKNLQNVKYAGAASAELAGTVNSLNATQAINKDALKEATAEQKKAAAETDLMNKKMQEFQSAIAEVGNKFKMLLVNSGMLDYLMQAFSKVAALADQFLVPAFNMVVSVAMKLWSGISLLLAPVIDYISEKFGSSGLGGTVDMIDSVMNTVFPILAGIVRGAIMAFDGLYAGVMAVFQPLKELMTAIFGVSDGANGFGEILIMVGDIAGQAFRIFGELIGAVVKFLTPSILIVADGFKMAFAVVKGLVSAFSALMDGIQDVGMFFDQLMADMGRSLNKIGIGDMTKERHEQETAQREHLKQQREEERAARKAVVGDTQAQHKVALAQDAKRFAEQKVTHNKLTDAAKKEAAAKEAAVKAQEKLLDYSAGPEELLKQFSAKQGGGVEIGIKKKEAGEEKAAADAALLEAKTTAEKKAAILQIEQAEQKLKALDEVQALAKSQGTATAPAAAAADTAKKGLEADALQKAAADAAKSEADRKAQEAADKKTTDAAKPPESAETLLAQLNTHMAKLITLTAQTTTNTYETVVATKGLNSNLYKR